MSRRRKAEKRPVLPDPKYKDVVVSKFMSCLMFDSIALANFKNINKNND